METIVMQEQKTFFTEKVKLTGVKEYGFAFNDLATGTASIPASGAKFDIYFEGEVEGERLNGKLKGVDYLTVRADGKLELNLQASITTEDGAIIKVEETGNNHQGALKLFMKFHSNHESYVWLNQVSVLGLGTVSFSTGEVNIEGYLI